MPTITRQNILVFTQIKFNKHGNQKWDKHFREYLLQHIKWDKGEFFSISTPQGPKNKGFRGKLPKTGINMFRKCRPTNFPILVHRGIFVLLVFLKLSSKKYDRIHVECSTVGLHNYVSNTQTLKLKTCSRDQDQYSFHGP